MPNVEIDGTNSTVKTNVLTSQSCTTITVPTGKVLTVTDAAGLTVNGVAPLTSIADNSITLAKMAGGTDGQIITYDASGDPVAVGPGTSGQVLTSAGANAPPTFSAAAAGGAWTFLSTTTASNAASIDITSADGLNNTLYAAYAFYLESVYSNSSGQHMGFRTSDDDGSTWDTSPYFHVLRAMGDDGTDHDQVNTGMNYIRIDGQPGAGSNVYGAWGWVHASADVSTINGPGIQWNISNRDAGNDFIHSVGAGAYNSTPDSGGIDAYQLRAASGNISGTVHVYGVKLS